jgi:hypothetical protein
MVGASCLLFGILLGGSAAYHVLGGKQGIPLGSVLGGMALLVSGVLILLRSSAFAAKLTEDYED